MYKLLPCLLALILFLLPGRSMAEQEDTLFKLIKNSKEQFKRHVHGKGNDSAVTGPLVRHIEKEVNSIYTSVSSDKSLNVLAKEKALRSLVYFLTGFTNYVSSSKIDIYDIPAVFDSYKGILQGIIKHKPYSNHLNESSAVQSQLLISAFTQYPEHALLKDISVYKSIAASPEYILQFLESKPDFRFADSLIVDAAEYDALKLSYYISSGKNGISQEIGNVPNKYIQQLVLISKEKSASELLPFTRALAENKLTKEEIITKRTVVDDYFQLLTNTLMGSNAEAIANPGFLKPVRKGIKEKALAFYVNPINELHNAADLTRFAAVKNLRAEDLYYIITTCGEELYTSSYLGLYKRLVAKFTDHSADSIFTLVRYDNFHEFMGLAANYNVLSDFLHKMPKENASLLLKRTITGINGNAQLGLERAMNIADLFAGLGGATDLIQIVQDELQSNLKYSKDNKQYLGMRLYSILLQVFSLVKEGDAKNALWKTLGNYEELQKASLENKKGEVAQLVLFYGDEDGIASYQNFLRHYSDAAKWQVTKTPNWVNIRSTINPGITIYANLPLDIKEELDLRAQDSLIAFINTEAIEPSILIHRGHSYHLDKTLKKLTPSIKLAVLGSCGGYNKAISMAMTSPDIQVIGSKKTGAKSINDPIIEMINETILTQGNISWPEVWKKLQARFSKDEATLSLFNEYFPPSNNMSLFVLKLFKLYNRFV